MTSPMNVLFILSEHHNPAFLGCAGHPIVRTPHLDRLAGQGARFDYTYCGSPLCVPARAALWSGRYSHETGVWCNATPWDGRSGGWPAWLRDHGAHVTTVGKLDFAPGADCGIADERLARHRGSLDIHSLYREQPIIPRYSDIAYIRAPRRREDYPDTDAPVLAESLRWLREDRPTDRPWLLNVNFLKTHPVWAPPPEVWDRYDPLVRFEDLPAKYRQSAEDLHPYFRTFSHHQCDGYTQPDDIRRAHVGFLAFCEILDAQVGSLLQALEDLGIADNTMVVYSSDHGAAVHAHHCWAIMNPWEDTARVPLIVRYPGGAKGVVDQTPTHHHDVLPTICEAMGLAPPADFRGHSLMNTAAGGDTAPRREYTFCEVHANGWPGAAFAVSDGHIKYVECVGERPAMFDLDTDPQELHDLVAERPEDPAVQEHIRRMRGHLGEICSPQAVDARAKDDQSRLRTELRLQGRLGQELVKRGYEAFAERLVPRREVLEELGIEG